MHDFFVKLIFKINILHRVIGGPILGLFFLALFVPFSNSKGAFVGTLTSLCFLIWLFLGYNIYGIKYAKKEFCTYGCPPKDTLTNGRRILGLEDSLRPYLLVHDEKSPLSNLTNCTITQPGS